MLILAKQAIHRVCRLVRVSRNVFEFPICQAWAILLVFIPDLLIAKETSCPPVPADIVTAKSRAYPGIGLSKGYTNVIVEFPKYYKSLHFQTLALKINSNQSNGDRMQFIANLKIEDSDLFYDDREFLVKAVELIDENGNYLVDTVDLIDEDDNYLIEASELIYSNGNYLIDIAYLIDENDNYLIEIADLVYEDKYFLISAPDLPVKNENRILYSLFELSAYENDVITLTAVYSEACTSYVDIVLDLDELIESKPLENNQEIKPDHDNPSILTPVATFRNYSFEHGQPIGDFHSGSLGSYSVNFPEPDELYNEYEKATITMRKKSGVDYPIDKIEVSIHDYQCDTIPSTFFKIETDPTEKILLPQSFSVTEPGCIELKYHALAPSSGESMLVDKFQIMLSE